MALYAFDGTWQSDFDDPGQDTNVVKFREAYDGPVEYFTGVGTRKGWLGRFLGALVGAGGRDRVREALAAFRHNSAAGDNIVDIIGFSRGAALALHFANSLPDGTPIRFVGLFDTVPSFGIPGNMIDLGWRLGLPGNAARVCHAMALDETRFNFVLHRLEPNPQLTERWFRGVHSDVGGGNGNSGLASIALNWMFEQARKAGLNLRTHVVLGNRTQMRPEARPSRLVLTSRLRCRRPRPTDTQP